MYFDRVPKAYFFIDWVYNGAKEEVCYRDAPHIAMIKLFERPKILTCISHIK